VPQVQAIVYSAATGRVRWVHDPERDVADPQAYLASIAPRAGEAVTLITKRAASPQRNPTRGNNTLHDWQAVASIASKRRPVPMHPDVDAHVIASAASAGVVLEDVVDRYCVIDAAGNILRAIHVDPACGDSVQGCILVAHASANSDWTYDPVTGVFTAPPVPVPVGPLRQVVA
jgi:hypothetical protein